MRANPRIQYSVGAMLTIQLLLTCSWIFYASAAQSSACSSLIAAKTNLASKCLCKDQDFDSDRSDQDTSDTLRIGQLTCVDRSFGRLFLDLAKVLTSSDGLANKNSQIPHIDYMSLSVDSIEDESPHIHQTIKSSLTVDHLALSIGAHKRSADLIKLQEELSHLSGLFNRTQVQFLSIIFDSTTNSTQRTNSGVTEKLNFGKLFSQFTGLSRLELSLGTDWASLNLNSKTFVENKKLKWLNLASNGRLNIEATDDSSKSDVEISPFVSTTSLEYLNLERNQLDKFPIFMHLNHKLYSGLPNLIFLNLAFNGLKSLSRDFFYSPNIKVGDKFKESCINPNENSDKFSLPSLNQLDLSHNKLSEFTFADGQYLLCIMPNLSQLYLRNNLIVHINLNSLLAFPYTPIPVSLYNELRHPRNTSYYAKSVYTTKLEHLDISHNKLYKLTAIDFQDGRNSFFSASIKRNSLVESPRIKFINLSNNRLENIIDLINYRLINRILFDESFTSIGAENKESVIREFLSLQGVQESFEFAVHGDIVTICDFLSPASTSKTVDDTGEILTELLLSNNQLSSLNGSDFSSNQCKQIQILKLSKNQLRSIENSTFAKLAVLEYLDLSHNRLSKISDTLFQNNLNLKVINLSNNQIESIQRNTLSNLNNIEEILLNNNELNNIPDGLFLSNEKLSVIDISDNRIDYISDKLISHLLLLKYLNLNGNRLKEFNLQQIDFMAHSRKLKESHKIKTSTLKSNRNPETNRTKKVSAKRQNRRQVDEMETSQNILILNDNSIESLEFGDYKCAKFLTGSQIVWLNDNKIVRLTRRSFRCFGILQKLNLRSNVIRSIEKDSFQDMRSLEHLDLSRNQISHIVQSTFNPIALRLRHLDLGENQLIQFKISQVFSMDGKDQPANIHEIDSKVTAFEVIKLNNNPNLSVDANDLLIFITKNQLSLKRIDLSAIKKVSQKIDGNITEVNQLNLDNFSVKGVQSSVALPLLGSFLSDCSIREIDLASISLDEIHQKTDTFNFLDLNPLDVDLSDNQESMKTLLNNLNSSSRASHIMRLALKDNQLDNWPLTPKITSNLRDLSIFDLSGNKLRYMMKAAKDHVDLSSYRLDSLGTLNLSSNSIVGFMSVQDEKFTLAAIFPRLRHLDLSHNRIAHLSKDLLNHLDYLLTVNLSYNHFDIVPEFPINSNAILWDLSFNPKLRPIKRKWSDHKIVRPTLDNDEAIVQLRNGPGDQPICRTIDQYIADLNFEGQTDVLPEYLEDMTKHLNSEFHSEYSSDDETNHDVCSKLIKSSDLILLESSSSSPLESLILNILNNQPDSEKFIHLQLEDNFMFGLDFKYLAKDSILPQDNRTLSLDLANNKISDPRSLDTCEVLTSLLSVDLEHNHLRGFPIHMLKCRYLNYLNLANNRIQFFGSYPQLDRESRLKVLDLRYNQLNHLDAEFLQQLKHLRHLDLRGNNLKFTTLDKRFIRHIEVISTNHPNMSNEIHSMDKKLLLDVMEDSFDVQSSKLGMKYRATIYQSNGNISEQRISIYSYPGASRHKIKFCTLGTENNLTQICFDPTTHQNLDSDKRESHCIYLRRTITDSSCLTNLNDTKFSQRVDRNAQVAYNSKQVKGLDHEVTTADKNSTDFVLMLIDSAKSSWLSLKQLNVDSFSRSLLNYQIFGHKLSQLLTNEQLVKVAIFIGSVGVIVLAFVWLACLGQVEKESDDLSSTIGSNSEITSATQSNDTSRSSIPDNSKSSSSANRTTTSTGSSNKSDCNAIPSGSTTQKTVVDRKIYQLDAGELVNSHHYPTHPLCSTPSSSLAPSSVETAETLQAVDSIQSGNSTCHYGELTPTGQPNLSAGDRLSDTDSRDYNKQQHHNHNQHIGAILRMVKSNSTSFNPGNRFANLTQFGTLQSNFKHPKYQTNSKSRLNQKYRFRSDDFSDDSMNTRVFFDESHMNDNQQQNPYILSSSTRDSMEFVEPPPALNDYDMAFNEDPTTLSLLSINTVLSNGNAINLYSTNENEAKSQSAQEHLDVDHQHNICQYHRQLANSGVILELQEDEQNLNDDSLTRILPPPPPPSKIFQALEHKVTRK